MIYFISHITCNIWFVWKSRRPIVDKPEPGFCVVAAFYKLTEAYPQWLCDTVALQKNVNMTKAGNQCGCDCVCDMLMLILGTCWTTLVFMSMLKSHSHALMLSHSLTLSLTLDMVNNFCFLCLKIPLCHSLTLDMPNNFCFHVYAPKVVIGRTLIFQVRRSAEL